MIAGAVKLQRDAPNFTDRSPDVIVKAHLVFRGDKWTTFLRREDYVIKQIGVGVRHVLKLTRLSRNGSCIELSLAPRAHSCWALILGLTPQALCCRRLRRLVESPNREAPRKLLPVSLIALGHF